MSGQVINVAWSWLRVYLAAALTYVLASLSQGTPLEWRAVGIAGVVALLPVVVNWLNTADPRYGRGSGDLEGDDPELAESLADPEPEA